MHKKFLQNLSETKIFAPFRTRVRFRCRRRAAGRMRILSKAARAVSGGRTEEIPDSRSPPTQRLATRLVALLPHFFFSFHFTRGQLRLCPRVCVCVWWSVKRERERGRQAGRQLRLRRGRRGAALRENQILTSVPHSHHPLHPSSSRPEKWRQALPRGPAAPAAISPSSSDLTDRPTRSRAPPKP
jgi:hypothetical protein